MIGSFGACCQPHERVQTSINAAQRITLTTAACLHREPCTQTTPSMSLHCGRPKRQDPARHADSSHTRYQLQFLTSCSSSASAPPAHPPRRPRQPSPLTGRSALLILRPPLHSAPPAARRRPRASAAAALRSPLSAPPRCGCRCRWIAPPPPPPRMADRSPSPETAGTQSRTAITIVRRGDPREAEMNHLSCIARHTQTWPAIARR